MAGTWEVVDSKHQLILGDSYRLKLTVLYPYSVGLHDKILDAMRLYNKSQRDYSVDVPNVSALELPPHPIYGPTHPWVLTIPFKKLGGGTPMLVVIGLLIAAIAIPVILGAIFSKQFEHFVSTAGTAVSETATNLVPLGIIVVAALFLLR